MGIEHSGLSGIRAATTDLSTTGNNVANAGTVGFKGSTVEFADIISGTVGGGVSVSGIRQSFTQGSILGTGNDWDLAISGRGFFKVSDSGGQANTTKESYYTRNGAFSMDKSGYVVNSRGMRLHMYPASGTGDNVTYPISTSTQEILLPQEDSKASTTTLATTSYNLDAGSTARATGTVTGATTAANNGGTDFVVSINGVAVTVAAANLVDGSATAANRDTNLLAIKNAINAANITGVTATIVDSATAGADTMKLSAVGVDVVVADVDASDTQLSGLSAGTTTATVATAVNPSSSTSYEHSVALVVYDTLGEQHTVNTFFQKTKNGVWDIYTQRVDTDGTTYPSGGKTATHSGTMEFDGSGVLTKLTSANTTNGAVDSVVYDTASGINISNKISVNTAYTSPATIGANGWFDVDLSGTSQFAGDFRIVNLAQDGYASGALTSVDINESGVIQANYTNGNATNVGKIALMAFNNPGGLKQSGGVLWAKTSDSGDPRPGAPGESIYGRIKSQSLESSTVDVTEQLVNLITAQRNFQANAKMISAGQEMNQVVLNI